MRIQHNIMAMNAYRNYNTNTSALSKNLEKLSSGYKINRAGDDAAGLAISEKMRAQITGLDAAQKNVKDGISLVKTAEGAMQEIQDMLNRMDYLATQSSNGTYDNETDRAALQKEVDQLKSEINRIADSANFNGIKLLDGSLDPDARQADTDTVFSGKTASVDINKAGNSNADGALNLTGAMGMTNDEVQYHKKATDGGKTSFTIDLDAMGFECDAGKSVENVWFVLDNNDGSKKDALCLNKEEVSSSNVGSTNDSKNTHVLYSVTAGNSGITAEDIASAIMKAINDDGEGDGIVYIRTNDGAKDQYIQYKVTQDGSKLNFAMTNDGYNTAVKVANDTTNTSGDPFRANFNFGSQAMVAAVGTVDTNDTAKDFIAAKDQHIATSNTVEGGPSAGTQYAQAVIHFDEGTTASTNNTTGTTNKMVITNKASEIMKDGAGIQIGDEYYVFAASDEVLNGTYADNVKVVDIRKLDVTDGDDLRIALTRFSHAAADNAMFDVQVGKGNECLVVTERTTYSGDADLTETGLMKQIQAFKGSTSITKVDKESGSELTLQIGDTSDDYNQLKVKVGDMHTKAMGIADINIGNQEGAAAAIQTIRNAINYVSSVRGDLGATQNRLEHTGNNLSVMAENIQDAESTIRDTDVANEMMSYVKNNILVQSAQAMLAQANQVPQGVLQLLG